MTEGPQRYIGDGVYASLDPARMIILSTDRSNDPRWDMQRHWIALEPEVLFALVEYACDIGWGAVVVKALEKFKKQKPDG